MAKAFHDLLVWQRSMELSLSVYRITEGFPRSETYGLSSQMRRAAVSIPSNLAEGSARGTKKDFRRFVMIAKGSVAELQTQILIAGRLGYGTEVDLRNTYKDANRVGQMLTKLAQYLARHAAEPTQDLYTSNEQRIPNE